MAEYFHIFNMDTLETLGAIPNDEKFLLYAHVGSPQFIEAARLMLPGSQWHNTRILCVGNDCRASEKHKELMDTVRTNAPDIYKKAFSFDENENLTLNNICCLLLPREIFGGEEIRFIFNHSLEEYIDLGQIKDKANTPNPLGILTLVSETIDDKTKDITGLWCGHQLSSSDALAFNSYKKVSLDFLNETK